MLKHEEGKDRDRKKLGASSKFTMDFPLNDDAVTSVFYKPTFYLNLNEIDWVCLTFTCIVVFSNIIQLVFFSSKNFWLHKKNLKVTHLNSQLLKKTHLKSHIW